MTVASRAHIKERLKLPLTTLCIAATAGSPGDLAEANSLLLDEIEKLVDEAGMKGAMVGGQIVADTIAAKR